MDRPRAFTRLRSAEGGPDTYRYRPPARRRRAPWAVFRVHEGFWVCESRDGSESTHYATWREAFDHAYGRARAKWPWWN